MLRRLIASIVLANAIILASMPEAVGAAGLVDVATIRLKTSYVIKAKLDYAAGTISAVETITLTNASSGPISRINLSVMPRAFGELTAIGSYMVDGVKTTASWTNNANLSLQLGRNVAVGETAVVRLVFKLRATSTVNTSLQGRFSKANGIMQVSHWFPIISDGHPMRYPGDSQYTWAASKIRLELQTESDAVRIAAPGKVILSSGRDHIYELTDARDFAFGASPSYRTTVGSAAGVKVVAYSTTGSGSTALSYAMSALTRLESLLGEYPWPRFVIAQTGRNGSGNEYPGIAFLGGPLFTSRTVVAHETAHQWFYAIVGNDQIDEPWLDEGIAEFLTAYLYGGFESYVSSKPVNTSSTAFPNIPAPLTSEDPGSYDQTIYYKSAKFLSGLRTRMGTATFFGALRTLVDEQRGGVMTTREFYRAMVKHGAPTSYLDAFIDL